MRKLLLVLCTVLVVSLTSAPARADGLILRQPVEGVILRGFQLGATPYSPGHRGVDISSPAGASVRAAADGVVHFSGRVAGRPSVSIDHGGGLRTTYTPVVGHVRTGEIVRAGTVIGTLQAGHCASPCLHWGLTDGHIYHNPLSYLSSRYVRLVPMGASPVVRASLPAASVPTLGPGDDGTPLAPGGPPVAGRVTSRFGMRVHPVTGIYKLHDGADFGAPCGARIVSPWAGTVVRRDVTRGYGYRVHVRHAGGLVTAYAHMPAFDVEVGQQIPAGARVGRVGSTGYSTGCHLHWMAWRDGQLIDPLTLLRR